MHIIDTHVHFWDPLQRAYPWIQSRRDLQKAHLPEDLDRDLGAGRFIDSIVVVEAASTVNRALDEAQWLDDLTTSEPCLGAVVAAVRFDEPRATESITVQLERLHHLKHVTGVRHNFQELPVGSLATSAMSTGARAAAAAGLTFDACIRGDQLRELTQFAQEVPELTIVLDHLGKPPVASGILEPWASDLRALAKCPNVVAKISGLPAEATCLTDYADQARPFTDTAMEVFGPKRLMLGSDWPVSTSANRGAYRAWWDFIFGHVLSMLPSDDALRLASSNATLIYRCPGKEPT